MKTPLFASTLIFMLGFLACKSVEREGAVLRLWGAPGTPGFAIYFAEQSGVEIRTRQPGAPMSKRRIKLTEVEVAETKALLLAASRLPVQRDNVVDGVCLEIELKLDGRRSVHRTLNLSQPPPPVQRVLDILNVHLPPDQRLF